LFLSGLSSSLLVFFRGDLIHGDLVRNDVIVAQLMGAAMVLGGGLLWFRRPQVAYGG
jgi:hypothetical protein